MTSHRVSRGRKAQQLLACDEEGKAPGWFNRNGWPKAASRPAALPGKDIMHMDGLAPEVKATEGQDFTGALRQAAKNAGMDELPFVIYQPRGYGPEKIDQWIVAFRLSDATKLLRKAGYGE